MNGQHRYQKFNPCQYSNYYNYNIDIMQTLKLQQNKKTCLPTNLVQPSLIIFEQNYKSITEWLIQLRRWQQKGGQLEFTHDRRWGPTKNAILHFLNTTGNIGDKAVHHAVICFGILLSLTPNKLSTWLLTPNFYRIMDNYCKEGLQISMGADQDSPTVVNYQKNTSDINTGAQDTLITSTAKLYTFLHIIYVLIRNNTDAACSKTLLKLFPPRTISSLLKTVMPRNQRILRLYTKVVRYIERTHPRLCNSLISSLIATIPLMVNCRDLLLLLFRMLAIRSLPFSDLQGVGGVLRECVRVYEDGGGYAILLGMKQMMQLSPILCRPSYIHDFIQSIAMTEASITQIQTISDLIQVLAESRQVLILPQNQCILLFSMKALHRDPTPALKTAHWQRIALLRRLSNEPQQFHLLIMQNSGLEFLLEGIEASIDDHNFPPLNIDYSFLQLLLSNILALLKGTIQRISRWVAIQIAPYRTVLTNKFNAIQGHRAIEFDAEFEVGNGVRLLMMEIGRLVDSYQQGFNLLL